MRDIVDDYLAGLRAAWEETDDKDSLREFALTHGASNDDLARLRAAYPMCPDALIELLRRVDGTYYRDYDGYTVLLNLLGSDVGDGEYPYYLQSADQILRSSTETWRATTIRRSYDSLEEWMILGRESSPGKGNLDDRIDPDLSMNRWLHFSDCCNNGGTSQLFVDFDPLNDGRVGQVIRFLHDPDSYAVIADSFEDYLQLLIDGGYSFVRPDE